MVIFESNPLILCYHNNLIYMYRKYIHRLCALLAMSIFSTSLTAAIQNPVKEAAEARTIIDKVNEHWQNSNDPEVNAFWDNAAYHTGNMEAYRLTGNEKWLDYSTRWA